MEGYPDGRFDPTDAITRAEIVVTINRALDLHYTLFNEAGEYGDDEDVQTINGSVVVSVDGVTLQNMIIKGDLILAEGIGEGDVTLDNVTVEGKTVVNGGGVESIRFNNSDLSNVIVNKENGKIRLVANGLTMIDTLRLESGAIVEAGGITGIGGVKKVIVEAPEEADVMLLGDFETVGIDSPNVSVQFGSGTIKNLVVNENSRITIGEAFEVETLTLNAATAVTGSGTVKKAIVNANGSTLENKPEAIEINGDDVTVEVDGEEISESIEFPVTPPPSNDGGDGGGNGTPPPSSGGGGGGGNGGDTTPPPSNGGNDGDDDSEPPADTEAPIATDAYLTDGSGERIDGIVSEVGEETVNILIPEGIENDEGPISGVLVFDEAGTVTNAADLPGNDESNNTFDKEFTYPFAGEPNLDTVKSSLPQQFTIEVEDGSGNKASYTVKLMMLKEVADLGVTISTRDAGDSKDKGGYSVTLQLPDGTTVGELSKLEVALYNGANQLVRNALAFDRIDESTKAVSRITSPFNIGTEGNNEWSWNRGAFPVDGELDESEVPNRIVIDYEKGDFRYRYVTNVENVRLPAQ